MQWAKARCKSISTVWEMKFNRHFFTKYQKLTQILSWKARCKNAEKNLDKCRENSSAAMNDCKKWEGINMYGKQGAIEFDCIYSENHEECGTIVDNIVKMWDIENGKNTMRVAQ